MGKVADGLPQLTSGKNIWDASVFLNCIIESNATLIYDYLMGLVNHNIMLF